MGRLHEAAHFAVRSRFNLVPIDQEEVNVVPSRNVPQSQSHGASYKRHKRHQPTFFESVPNAALAESNSQFSSPDQ